MALTNFVDRVTPISASFLNQLDVFRETMVQNGGMLREITGVSGSNTVTGVVAPVLVTYAPNLQFLYIPIITNTTAVTVALNGLPALPVLNTVIGITPGGEALIGGELIAGNSYILLLNKTATAFIVVNPTLGLSGSFVGTILGCTVAVPITLNWYKIGRFVELAVAADTFGTSNANTLAILGIPAILASQLNGGSMGAGQGSVLNNGSSNYAISSFGGGQATIITTSLLTSGAGLTSNNPAGFTTSGLKGYFAGNRFTYQSVV